MIKLSTLLINPRLRTFIFAGCIAGTVLLCIGCGGASGASASPGANNPTGPNSSSQTPASITIGGGNNQTAPVGGAVSILPSVVVKNVAGTGVSGVVVSFSISSGGGSVLGSAQTTNSSGIATVGGWTLGAGAGVNTLVASVAGLSAGSVTFTATATGPAIATITKIAGDNQTVQPGTAVAPGPTVKLADSNGNGISGIPVTFSVTSGGGVVTGGTVTTNSSGVATIGGWTVGPADGHPIVNSVTATAAGVSTVFNAFLPAPCLRTTPLVVSSSTTGSYAAALGSCKINGYPTDFYSFTLTQPTAFYRFSANSDAFAPLIALFSSTGMPVGSEEATFSTTEFGVLLAAGVYQLRASTGYFNTNAIGSYSIVNAPITTVQPPCGEDIFAVLTSTVWARALDAGCIEHSFRIYLLGGQHFTTYANSAAFTPLLTLVSPRGVTLSSTSSGIFDLAAPETGYFTIRVTTTVFNNRGAYNFYLGPPTAP